jgi:hypothetical protein
MSKFILWKIWGCGQVCHFIPAQTDKDNAPENTNPRDNAPHDVPSDNVPWDNVLWGKCAAGDNMLLGQCASGDNLPPREPMPPSDNLLRLTIFLLHLNIKCHDNKINPPGGILSTRVGLSNGGELSLGHIVPRRCVNRGVCHLHCLWAV